MLSVNYRLFFCTRFVFGFIGFFPLVNTVIAVVTFVHTLTIQDANRTRLKINTRV